VGTHSISIEWAGFRKIGISSMETEVVTSRALVVADDNPDMLGMLVEMLQMGYKVTAALPNGTSVLDQIAMLSPSLVILDISLGDLSGFEVAKRLRDSGCPAKIIFLTVHEDVDFVRAAFDIGVSGYVFKSRIFEDLIRAIDIVFDGGQFASVMLPSVQ
jgi:DNA-binding NarL/FixJ family response regulator